MESEVSLEEAIRRSVGVVVHDDLGQLLTGAAFLAQSLLQDVPEPLVPAASRLVRLVNQCVERAHEIAEGLAPAPSPQKSLDELLVELARTTTQTFGVECVFSPPAGFPGVEPDVASHLNAIAREAVINAVRHARGSLITIELTYIDGLRVLSVRDDGRGFPDSPRPGLGLRNMERRASMLGAVLELRAAAGRGAEVRCAW